MNERDNLRQIRGIVADSLAIFSRNFQARHLSEFGRPRGLIHRKLNNFFISRLGREIAFDTALTSSLESCMGTMIEDMATRIASISFDVQIGLHGHTYQEQRDRISLLIQQYRDRRIAPEVVHALQVRGLGNQNQLEFANKNIWLLVDREPGHSYILELQSGGELDSTKAPAQKNNLLLALAACYNQNPDIAASIHFATAYHRLGEGNPWPGGIRKYFAPEELMIGSYFWNFISRSEQGFVNIQAAYDENIGLLQDALHRIRERYLV